MDDDDDKIRVSCKLCGEPNLMWSWDFQKKRPLLVKFDPIFFSSEEIHECPKIKTPDKGDLVPAICKYCKNPDLFWTKEGNKYELIETYGLPHICSEYKKIEEAHKEAKREDYARTKLWLKTFSEDHLCKRCKGRGSSLRTRKGKRNRQVYSIKKCSLCRGIGSFTEANKRLFLKKLRKSYWPYRPWMQKQAHTT